MISAKGFCVLVSEFLASRVTKFWLKGPNNAFRSQVIINFKGIPDNIKRDGFRNFWVAVNDLEAGFFGVIN